MAILGSHRRRLSGAIPATPLAPMDSSRSQESTAANGSSFTHVYEKLWLVEVYVWNLQLGFFKLEYLSQIWTF